MQPGPEQEHEEQAQRTSLAPVFVNGARVQIESATPTVGDVLRKAGYDPNRSQIFLLRHAHDRLGKAVSAAHVLDLEGRRDPVYLRCIPRDAPDADPSIAPAMTSRPDLDPGRGLGMADLSTPVPTTPAPPMEPPGPPR
jgi:hypothetical protein